MQTKTTIQKSKAFNVKAVGCDESIYGYVRMSGREGRSFVKSICARFLINADRTIIYFEKDALFYYGDTWELRKNYNARDLERKIPEVLVQRFPEYEDKPYSPKTLEIDKQGVKGIGFVKILLDDLLLGTTQQNILQRLTAQAEQDLPDLVRNLVKEYIVTSDPNSMKHFGALLSKFPLELKERALDNGCYYRSAQHEYETTIEQMFTPNLKMVSGGLPSLGKRR